MTRKDFDGALLIEEQREPLMAKETGWTRSTIKNRIHPLFVEEHIRTEGNGKRGNARRLYPTHDRPIAHVRPREQVRVAKGRQASK